MGWKISVGAAGSRAGGRVAEQSVWIFPSVAGRAGARVRYMPNADRTASGKAGSSPAHQAEQVWRKVLGALVGTD
jgi:hypothetical protein